MAKSVSSRHGGVNRRAREPEYGPICMLLGIALLVIAVSILLGHA